MASRGCSNDLELFYSARRVVYFIGTFERTGMMEDKKFQFGDKVTCKGRKAIYLNGDKEGNSFLFNGISTPYYSASDKFTAGWLPEVYENGPKTVYDSDNAPHSPYVYVPNSFIGKKVKIRIEEILE